MTAKITITKELPHTDYGFAGAFIVFVLHHPKDKANEDEYYKKCEIVCREFEYIGQSVSRRLFGVFLKGNQTRERGDERACTADVYAEQELSVIVGKLREQYSRGDVTDYLTR